jgi:hypothetical protein
LTSLAIADVEIEPRARYDETMRLRTVLWILALAVIFGFGWRKSYENHVYRARRDAWDVRMQRLEKEWNQARDKEYERLVASLRSLHGQPGGRDQVIKELAGGDSLSFREEKGRDVASWSHPQYGIRVNLAFEGDRLVGHGLRGGSHVWEVYRMPPKPIGTLSTADHLRRLVVRWGPWVWFVCLLVAMASRSYGLAAAQMMLMITLACGVAWTVASNFPITVRGIFSNDKLFFAATMYVFSLVVLAIRVAPVVARSARPRLMQFGMRTLLSVMALVAVFSAMGPLGYFAMCVFAVGGALFFIMLQLLIGRQAAACTTDANGSLA